MSNLDASSLAHEVMHTFGAFAASGVPDPAASWLDELANHPVAQSDVNGIIDLLLTDQDGFLLAGENGNPLDLVANGDGTFRYVERIGEYFATFSPIVLYLAGFLAPEEVTGQFYVLRNIDDSDQAAITAEQVFSFDVGDIIAAEGPRLPASAEAPRDFRLGVVVVGERAFRPVEYHFITLALRYFELDKTYDGFGSPPWRAAALQESSVAVALPGVELEGELTLPVDTPVEPPAAAATRTAPLLFGWNLIGWTGDTTAVTEATAPLGGAFEAVFSWNAAGQTFLSYNPFLPITLNTLGQLRSGDGLWTLISSTGGAAWEQPAFTDPRTVSLEPGFNLVIWTGLSGTPVADAIAGLGDAVITLYTWDAASQRFLSFSASGPAFLNTATALEHGQGLWIQVSRALAWPQPSLEGVAAAGAFGSDPGLDALQIACGAGDFAACDDLVLGVADWIGVRALRGHLWRAPGRRHGALLRERVRQQRRLRGGRPPVLPGGAEGHVILVELK